MKFNKYVLALSFVIGAAFTGQASAGPIDTVIPPSGDERLDNGKPTYVYTHDLSDHGYTSGTTYTYGKLVIRLTDMNGNETGSITVGDQSVATGNIANNTRDVGPSAGNLFEIILNSGNLADLSADGELLVSIGRSTGNFYFAGSTLTLEERKADVPEPLSIALLGAGAVGFCLNRRRARKA